MLTGWGTAYGTTTKKKSKSAKKDGKSMKRVERKNGEAQRSIRLLHPLLLLFLDAAAPG